MDFASCKGGIIGDHEVMLSVKNKQIEPNYRGMNRNAKDTQLKQHYGQSINLAGSLFYENVLEI